MIRNVNLLRVGIVLFVLLFCISHASAEMWCASPNADDVTVCKTVDPTILQPVGGIANANLTLEVTWPVVQVPIQADIVLAIDCSGSMIDPEYSTLEVAKTGSKCFIDLLKEEAGETQNTFQVGVLGWGDHEHCRCSLDDNLNDVEEAIETVERETDPNENTDFNVGLDGAIKILNERRPNVSHTIILLSDLSEEFGPGPNSNGASEFERLKGIAKKNDYTIYLIAIGIENCDTTGRSQFITTMTTDTNGMCYPILNKTNYAELGGAIKDVYSKIYERHKQPSEWTIKDITVTDVLHDYVKVRDDFTIPPTTGPIPNVDGTTKLIWDVREEEVRVDKSKSIASWETSFGIYFDFRNLPVDVNGYYRAQTHSANDSSVVTYTAKSTLKSKSIEIPPGKVSINCPPVPTPTPSEDIAILSPISIYLTPPSFSEGQEATITATVQNIGKKDSGDFVVKFYANDALIGEEDVRGGLKSGEATTVETDWITQKNVDITVSVDLLTQSQTPSSTGTEGGGEGIPGFEAVFAIAGLVAIALLVIRAGRMKRD